MSICYLRGAGEGSSLAGKESISLVELLETVVRAWKRTNFIQRTQHRLATKTLLLLIIAWLGLSLEKSSRGRLQPLRATAVAVGLQNKRRSSRRHAQLRYLDCSQRLGFCFHRSIVDSALVHRLKAHVEPDKRFLMLHDAV
jgi:hypothetical protein